MAVAETDHDKPKPQRATARRIAYGGVCASLALLALAAIRLLPTADLALYALTSLCVAVAVVEAGLGGGTVSWLAAAILGMLVTGAATGVPFLLLFGPYALIKALIESGIRGAVPRILVKLLAADTLLALAALFFIWFLNADSHALPLPWWAIALLAQPVFLIYDTALTMLITLYVRRRHPAR
ncbi:MAG TPA: hypothetical protein VIL27_03080 [Clostridia bacterium]